MAPPATRRRSTRFKADPIVTLAWANSWFTTSRPKSEEWTEADDATKQQYLNWASSLIRSAFVFPDDFVLSENEQVKIAVCEQSLWLMRRPDEYPEILTLGLSQASAGPLSATFSKEFIAPHICQEAIDAIGDLGEFNGSGVNTARTRPLGW